MNNKLNYLNWRFILIAVAIFVCLIAIIYKIFSIQFFESNFLQNEGNKRYVKYKDVVPVRGTIYDRNNFPLAVSVINYDLYALRGFTKSQLLNISEKVDLDIDPEIEVFNKKTLLKKNISNITGATDKIKALTGRTFEWREELEFGEGTKYGFVAQELEPVLPELVSKALVHFDKDV